MEYGSEHAELYDAVFASRGKDFRREAECLAAHVRDRLPSARSVLDVACGTGAHLETLATLFDQVTGVDRSTAMLAVARRRLPGVPLHLGDMRTLALGRVFDAVTCMGAAVASVSTVEEMETSVARMAEHLAPGGVLIVEPWFFPANFLDGYVGGHLLVEPARVVSRVTRATRDGDRTRHEVRFTVAEPCGIREFGEALMVCLFTPAQYTAAFERAGCDVQLVDGFSLANGRPNSPGLFVGVRKP